MTLYTYSSGTANSHNDREQTEKISDLIARLGSKEGVDKKRARLALVNIGEPAVPQLIDAFQQNRTGLTHWEAAKALSQIGSQQATQVFIDALKDDDAGVRWLAAEGLIAIGRGAVQPLLKALEQQPDSMRLHEGMHHILHDFVYNRALGGTYQALLAPVLQALDNVEPKLEVPIAASKALQALSMEDATGQ